MDETPTPKTLEQLAQEIYQMALEKVGGIEAVYLMRNYPKTRPQGIPCYNNARDYDFFADISDDPAAFSLTFTEYQSYVVAIETILKEKGFTTQRVTISPHEFKSYLSEAESAQ